MKRLGKLIAAAFGPPGADRPSDAERARALFDAARIGSTRSLHRLHEMADDPDIEIGARHDARRYMREIEARHGR